jgi:hypothetical protein
MIFTLLEDTVRPTPPGPGQGKDKTEVFLVD